MFAAELVYQGLELALIGMGTVFAFLTVLVMATSLMSWLVRRFVLEERPQVVTRPGPKAGDDADVVAAIAAALRVHRSRH